MGADEQRRPALQGVLVADFSRVLAGPLATMMLADLGATVIKVERPGRGDDTRSWGPPYVNAEPEAMSTYFASVNRNKQSITLDLEDGADLGVARTLATRADVLIENFLPGRLARFGLDLAGLKSDNPGLVYCSISGFGRGAGAAMAGYDFLVQALGGLMSITGPVDGEPTKVGVALVDVLTGLHASIAILAALRERDHSGLGQQVDVNLLSSLLSSLVNQGTGLINGGAVPRAMGNQHPSIAPYETLRTGTGPLAVAVGNDRQFATFCAVLGLAQLADDARFDTNPRRVAHRDALIAELEHVLVGDTAHVWTDKLRAAGLAVGPVQDIGAALALAESLNLDPTVTVDAITTLASPLHLSQTPVRYHRGPPTLGADSADIRQWLTNP
jgi:crotonobetainyl-CoA:carnitine CoA-transferase CaiB-like acyl-CoA transferase